VHGDYCETMLPGASASLAAHCTVSRRRSLHRCNRRRGQWGAPTLRRRRRRKRQRQAPLCSSQRAVPRRCSLHRCWCKELCRGAVRGEWAAAGAFASLAEHSSRPRSLALGTAVPHIMIPSQDVSCRLSCVYFAYCRRAWVYVYGDLCETMLKGASAPPAAHCTVAGVAVLLATPRNRSLDRRKQRRGRWQTVRTTKRLRRRRERQRQAPLCRLQCTVPRRSAPRAGGGGRVCTACSAQRRGAAPCINAGARRRLQQAPTGIDKC
jgi:hypothetical protein